MTDITPGGTTPPSTPLYDQTSGSVSDDEYGFAPTGGDTGYGQADTGSEKADTAKQEASSVAGDAQDAAGHVASVAKDQAGAVASEAKSQAKDLYAQTTSQLKEQAGAQQQRVAEGLRSVSDELSSMADKSDGNGLASEIVRSLSGRAGSAAGFLDGRDPGSLLDEVKSFAARKPGTFIALAAGTGILAGRLTKALAANGKDGATSPTSSTDTAHAPLSTEPAAGYERTAEPFGQTPVEAGTVSPAPTPSFDDIVGDRPFGEQR